MTCRDCNVVKSENLKLRSYCDDYQEAISEFCELLGIPYDDPMLGGNIHRIKQAIMRLAAENTIAQQIH